MESLRKCPTCRSRVRAEDEWCPLCYARLAVPAPRAAVEPVELVEPEGLEVPEQVDAAAQSPAAAAAPGSRRARRVELDQLADAMLSELAASQAPVTLPGPLGRAFAAIGLGSGDSGGRKAVGIAVVCAAMVAVLTAGAWIAGLLL